MNLLFWTRLRTLLPACAWVAVAYALVLLVQATVGISDDEAYYWQLSRRWDWGFAYHPPGVVWLVGVFDRVGALFSSGVYPLVTRLPAVLTMLFLAISSAFWLKSVFELDRLTGKLSALYWAALIALPGVYAFGWMVVPDTVLFLGWLLLFRGVSAICFADQPRAIAWFELALGALIGTLSKFSFVFAVFSGFVAILIWARGRRRRSAVLVVLGFAGLGFIPTLIWNAQHEWVSFLYQFKERHASELSWRRYGLFWLAQLVLAGPLVLFAGRDLVRAIRTRDRWGAFIGLWALPPFLVFGVQPLFSSFKLHWMLIAWFPLHLYGVLMSLRTKETLWLKLQLIWGGFVLISVFAVTNTPLLSKWVTDVRHDVSNDLRGWDGLRSHLLTHAPDMADGPVLGAYYQTSSQAAYALGRRSHVQWVPRDQRFWGEWPTDWNGKPVVDSIGPSWPKLLQSALFVADSRYSAGPQYGAAQCDRLPDLTTIQSERVVKRIMIWRCEPIKTGG